MRLRSSLRPLVARLTLVAGLATGGALLAAGSGMASLGDPLPPRSLPGSGHRGSTTPGVPIAPREAQLANASYDGRLAFARIRYGSSGGRGFGFGGAAWAHDYPNADRNMQVMLDEFTAVRAHTDASIVLDLEDPEIFRNPILYVSEPGYWWLTPEGAGNLRAHLLKGGFLMFDDFEARQWDNMAEQLAKALPEGVWVDLDSSHPVFRTFFKIDDIYVPHPSVRVTPAYRAIFEDNDPSRRIMVLANHNSDLAEYWEYAAQGFFPVDPTNDAFRLGINYFVYGLTY